MITIVLDAVFIILLASLYWIRNVRNVIVGEGGFVWRRVSVRNCVRLEKRGVCVRIRISVRIISVLVIKIWRNVFLGCVLIVMIRIIITIKRIIAEIHFYQ